MSQQAKLPVWYHQHRREVEGVFARSKAGGCATQSSPSGRYALNVTQYSTGPGTWGYSRGEVLERTNGRLIATVDRNFSAFPFSWCENHFVGHDYLLAGEDYQGQTVVELDTGVRIDHIPREAENGGAFVGRRLSITRRSLSLCGRLRVGRSL